MTDPTPNAPMPEPLSPASKAALDAYWEVFNAPLEGALHRPLAAALCAVALYLDNDCQQLIAIATELEGE